MTEIDFLDNAGNPLAKITGGFYHAEALMKFMLEGDLSSMLEKILAADDQVFG